MVRLFAPSYLRQKKIFCINERTKLRMRTCTLDWGKQEDLLSDERWGKHLPLFFKSGANICPIFKKNARLLLTVPFFKTKCTSFVDGPFYTFIFIIITDFELDASFVCCLLNWTQVFFLKFYPFEKPIKIFMIFSSRSQTNDL